MECKKAQPKEVMLPTTMARTRAAAVPRGNYGEFYGQSGFRYSQFNCHIDGTVAAVNAAMHAASLSHGGNSLPLLSNTGHSSAEFVLHTTLLGGNTQTMFNLPENYSSPSATRHSSTNIRNEKNSFQNMKTKNSNMSPLSKVQFFL